MRRSRRDTEWSIWTEDKNSTVTKEKLEEVLRNFELNDDVAKVVFLVTFQTSLCNSHSS